MTDSDIPFDLRHLNRIQYDSAITEQTSTDLIENLKKGLRTKINQTKQDPNSLRYNRAFSG